jgi:hypothetical protein
MKKQFFIWLLLSLPNLITAQSIFEKYQNDKDVTAINISPKIFQLLGSMSISSGDPESDVFMEMINGIQSFKALITGSSEISIEMDQWVKSTSKQDDLDQMVAISQDGTDLVVHAKPGEGEGKLKSLLMFSKGISSAVPDAKLQGTQVKAVLLMIEGDIALDKIAKLIEKMNLPGGEELKKAGI